MDRKYDEISNIIGTMDMRYLNLYYNPEPPKTEPTKPTSPNDVLTKCKALIEKLEKLEKLEKGYDALQEHRREALPASLPSTTRSARIALEKWRREVHLEHIAGSSKSPLEKADPEILEACKDV